MQCTGPKSRGHQETVIHGDCFEALQNLDDASFDMILTDPPYARTQCKWDVKIDIHRMMEEFFRIIKPHGAIAITATQPFATDVINAGRNYFRYDLVWEKTQGVGYLNANKMPLRAHEHILIFYKKLPTYNPQKLQYDGKPKGCIKKNQSDRVYGKTGPNGMVWKDDGTRHPKSVINVSEPERADTSRNGQTHPTQKPLALFEWLIRTYTNEGDIVLDPFAGSGTTAVACKRNHRPFFIIEKEEAFVQMARCRLANECEVLPIPIPNTCAVTMDMQTQLNPYH